MTGSSRENHAPAPGPRPRGRALLVTLACFTAFGVVLASQVVLSSAMFGREVPWLVALTAGLSDSWPWLLFVPPVLWLAGRFPIASTHWARNAALLLVGAVVVTSAYGALWGAINVHLIPDDLQLGRYMRPPRPPPESRPDGPAREGTAESGREGGPGARERGGRNRGRDAENKEPSVVDRARFNITTRWHMHLLIYAAIVGAAHWQSQQQRLREREDHARDLSRQLAEARLQALRMQLNPHFLFNTLNAIATLLHRAPDTADEMISSLSDFLRLTLNSNNQPQSTLERELEFARRYLDIEKVRFGERLTYRESIDPQCLEAMVPTLVLQPLLENAIRHGIEPLERRGEIDLAASRESDRLIVVVSDSGPGLTPKTGDRVGIGLANTRQRLQELHGADATLELKEREGGGLRVELRIPWTKMPATSPQPT